MRLLSFVFLVIVAAAVGIFAWQNNTPVTLRLYDWFWTTRLELLIAACYVLGMFSGWFVIGMVGRSWHRVVDERYR